jgi:hypothetical protein
VAVGDRVVVSPGWGGMAERVKVKAARRDPAPRGVERPTPPAFLCVRHLVSRL